MKLIVSLVAVVLLAGCSTVDRVRDAWNWDPTATQERTRMVSSSGQLAPLIDRMVQLQMQRAEIRTRISAEPNIWLRQRLYADLHRVGQQLSPLERELTNAPAGTR